MRKCVLLLCFLLLAGPGQMAFGQKKVQTVTKALGALVNPTRQKVASLTEGLTDAQLRQILTKLQKENASLEHQIANQRLLRKQVLEVSRPAVFRSLRSKGSEQSFSGTIFKTQYQGKEEIFGVVPMHVLRNNEMEPDLLSYKFTAGVFTEQGMQYLPAWVVQISSSKTGDVALVKFREKDEELLSPLTLSQEQTTFPQHTYSQGFANNLLADQSFFLVGKTSNNTLLAQIPAAYTGGRKGFCGSPVVSEQAQLEGIHVGSSYKPQDPDQRSLLEAFSLSAAPIKDGDIGYVTPVSYLEKLVEAYHQPTARLFPVVLGGHEITRLQAQEYVSRIELIDKNGHVFWYKDSDYKVSYAAAETMLRLSPQAAYIRVYIGRSHWVKNNAVWYVKNTDGVSSVLYPLPPGALRK